MTTGLSPIPGTSFVVTVDTGALEHVVRILDTTLLAAGSDPVVSRVVFPLDSILNWGIAFAAPNRVFVATNDGVVQALTVDLATGALVRDDSLSIPLPPGKTATGAAGPWFASGVAASPDAKKLVVSGVRASDLLVFDIDPQSANYGMSLGTVALGGRETFGVAFDPHDPAGQFVYTSMWADHAVVEVDLLAASGPQKTRSFATGKAPSGVAYLDGRWMVVANGLGDGLSLVDRVSNMVYNIPLEPTLEMHGFEPTALAYDEANKRLWVALAGVSAVAVFAVDPGATPPTLSFLGDVPTLWWPTAVASAPGGGVLVTSLRGQGTGPESDPTATGPKVYQRLQSGITHIPALADGAITTYDAAFRKDIDVGSLVGHPVVNCPAGANDFPVPQTNAEGPSPILDHIFIVVRENKTFDALLGDYPGVNGDPSLTLAPAPADMARIWQNLRALADRFVVSDNFYTAAEVSTLGHAWTTFGRSTDFGERTWVQGGYGRPSYPYRSFTEAPGVYPLGRPEEGGLFDWLVTAGISHDILGEEVGTPASSLPDHLAVDFKYPGGFANSVGWPDVEKACYVAGRARVLCDLGKVVYMTLSNDHTLGVSDKAPLPEVMYAVNDEATGLLLEGLSQSPLWASSLVFILEDDTAQGGDHVDSHRTLLMAASPWVKRGYVSKTHIDVSSIHKIITHVFGLPYPNLQVAHAGLPLDMFTSTPDFSPFKAIPRAEPLGCGDGSKKPNAPPHGSVNGSWDVSAVDRSPGLDNEVTRWMRRSSKP